MAVTVTITFDKTELVSQQSSEVTVELTNGGKTALHAVNRGHQMWTPILRVKNADTGVEQEFEQRTQAGGAPESFDLEPGQSWTYRFFLADWLQFPGPGTYEVSASYVWDDGVGEATSKPVVVTVQPAVPRMVRTVSPAGSIGGTYLSAWVNHPNKDPAARAVYLSTIDVSDKPGVCDVVKLNQVDEEVSPVVSVAANDAPFAQWVAWVAGAKLQFVLCVDDKSSGADTFKLPSENFSILPPLLENPLVQGEAAPGADVLLYESIAEPPGGVLHVLTLGGSQSPRLEKAAVLPGLAPKWAKTAYLGDRSRFTFLVMPVENGVRLDLVSWSPGSPPQTIEPLATWGGKVLAADLVVRQSNDVLGAVLVDQGSGDRRYKIYKWAFTAPDRFGEFDAIDVTLPVPIDVKEAVLRVNDDGAPFALLKDAKKGEWVFCGPDGKGRSHSDPAAVLAAPLDILFRRALEPTIMYTKPGTGFLFTKP